MRDGGTWLGEFLGALLAFVAPGAAVLGAAVLTSSAAGERISGGEWVTAAVAAVVASAAAQVRDGRGQHREALRADQAATTEAHQGE
jgi:hypothetical protein